MSLNGMHIVSHSLAVTTRHEVQRHPIRKKRRNWCVVRVTRPGCFQVGDVFYMHPELIEKLKQRSIHD